MAAENQKTWTLLETLSWTADYFAGRGIDSPRLTAELLLCHCLEIARLDLYLEFDRPLNSGELDAYRALIRRRIRREPVAYITGTKGFWDMEVALSSQVLIPRPDTETLVKTALGLMDDMDQKGRPLTVLELGSGSGAVVVSLARARPTDRFVAVDLSPAAARVTRQNVRESRCSDRVAVVTGSWFEAFSPAARFDLIVSNPPYIPTGDIDSLEPEIRDYEPRLALDGGPDGLDAIRRIIGDAHAYLAPGGALLLETGFDQKAAVTGIAAGAAVYAPPRSIRDEAGHHRVVCIKKKIE